MTEKTKEYLAYTDNLLATADKETANEIWSVLTALRAADDGDKYKKDFITIPIRRAAFSVLSRLADTCQQSIHLGDNICHCPTCKFGAVFEKQISEEDKYWINDESDHFNNHAIRAARILGLENKFVFNRKNEVQTVQDHKYYNLVKPGPDKKYE